MNIDMNMILGSCRGRDRNHPYVEGPIPFFRFNSGNHGFIRLDPAEARYLHRVARLSRVGMLEVGRYLGGSTILLGYASQTNNNVPVTSVDIDPLDDERLTNVMVDCGLDMDSIELRVDDSHICDYGEQQFDFAFIDGEHTYDGVLADMVNCWDNLVSGAHIILHDLHDDDYGIGSAVFDFITDKNVVMHVSPYHLDRAKYGTFCHFQKVN